MAKKRSCRRTADEDRIHEKAVKMRKMTDEQLVHYVEDRVEKARSEGFNRGREMAACNSVEKPVRAFIEKLQDGKVPGIGAATVTKIRNAAREYGYIQ